MPASFVKVLIKDWESLIHVLAKLGSTRSARDRLINPQVPRILDRAEVDLITSILSPLCTLVRASQAAKDKVSASSNGNAESR